VVAGEIKILAGETTAATLTITDQIREIQKTIGSTVADIDESAAVIQQVDEGHRGAVDSHRGNRPKHCPGVPGY